MIARIAYEFHELCEYFIGAFEYIVAEALARILNAGFYCWNNCSGGAILREPYILWNGYVESKGYVFEFHKAPQGLPDIELHADGKRITFEITLASSPLSMVNELRELVKHRPRLKSDVYAKILLVAIPENEI